MEKTSFAVKLSKFGDTKNGERRAIIIPKEHLDDLIKTHGSNQVKVTIEKI